MVRIARIMWVERIRRVVRVRGMVRIARIMRIMRRMDRMSGVLILPDPRADTGRLEPVEARLVLTHVRGVRTPVEALLNRTRVRILTALHRHCCGGDRYRRHGTSSQEECG
jgi:hypothetical protein